MRQVNVLKYGEKSDIGGPYYTKVDNGLTAVEFAEKTLLQRNFGSIYAWLEVCTGLKLKPEPEIV